MIGLLLPPSHRQKIKRVYRFLSDLVGRRTIVKMILSSLCLSFLDFMGFVILFPFIKVATDPVFQASLQAHLTHYVPLAAYLDRTSFIALISGLVILYFIVRALVSMLLTRYQLNVAANVTILSTRQLITAALYARYQLFLEEGAVKIAGIGYSNTAHASIVFQSVVSILNELTVLIIIFVSFALISPITVAVIAFIALLLGRFIFLPYSRKAANLGRITRDYDMARHRFIHSMVNAIRDIKIMGLEETFTARNSEISQRHGRLNAEYQALSIVLRILVEVLMMITVVVACLWFVFSSANIVEVAPVLATLALVVNRVAPAVSRLAANFNSFRFSLPVVEQLIDMNETITRYSQIRSETAINYAGDYLGRDISFSYRDKAVIKGVTLDIPFGSIVALIGPSGSGKSTLLDLLSGLQLPSSGQFTMDGTPFSPFHCANFNRLIGYVPQSIALLDASLAYNIALEDEPDPERLAMAIRKAHLEVLVQSLPEGTQTMLGEGGSGVSGGQRQRIGIARALYRQPSLLVLDEVTSALDADTARDVMRDLLALRGETTILIVSHDMSLIKADRIYHLVEGRLNALETPSV